MSLTVLEVAPSAAPGQMTYEAWRAARTGRVFATSASLWADALTGAGVPVERVDANDVGGAVQSLLHACRSATAVVWIDDRSVGANDVAVALTQAALAVESLELSVVVGATAPQGSAVAELVRTMDLLRSPGGCPWDAEQTHQTLLKYLLEESYEVVDAVEAGDDDHLREELGDLLLQIVFHARIAQERADGFDIDEVARGINDKMVRRHPHVFGSGTARTADEVAATWEDLKQSEKQRTSALEGIATAQPSLSLAQAYVRRAGELAPVSAVDEAAEVDLGAVDGEAAVGDVLMAVIRRSAELGIDAETALRAAAGRFAAEVRAAEARSAGERAE